jgi:hypothetical protein
MKTRDLLQAFFVSALIVVGLDLLTNTLDTQKYAWDFRYYIAIAKDGFNAQPMASPFAYRYLTPLLVRGLNLTGISIQNGFLVVAYFGAITQLTGVIMFVYWATKSLKGAYLAMLVTALSLFNVKFLLFDIYRPDHLAYALILLSTYFAFERKFLPLLVVTIIASQIREFAIVPLIAYLFSFGRLENRKTFIAQTSISALLLLTAIILPRLLIPVTENYQIVGLSKEGIITALALPFIATIDINFIFSILAYLLPLLVLSDIKSTRSAFASLPGEWQSYLGVYIILVLILSFLGGTDFFRFTTFLFLPQVLLIGLLTSQSSDLQIGFMLLATFIFNRIWLPFPIWDKDKYLDFYGAFSLRLNWNTLFRFTEGFAFVAAGLILRKMMRTAQS